MIQRSHVADGIRSTAAYSDCGAYRYSLARSWDGTGGTVLFVMLNPSTATEAQSDPTIRRCEIRARDLGFAGFSVANLFAYRATDPRILRQVADPVGPGNDDVLAEMAGSATAILCAWGHHGALLDRAARAEALLRRTGRPLLHLGLTASGQPRHPLYLPRNRQPEPWIMPPSA